MNPTNQYQIMAQNLIAEAGDKMWPLAFLYYDHENKTIKLAMLNAAGVLLRGHGKKIADIIEAKAREITISRPLRKQP